MKAAIIESVFNPLLFWCLIRIEPHWKDIYYAKKFN
jgi:hypothetical protein